MTPHAITDFNQHCFRQWLVVWRHQTLTLTKLDLSSMVLRPMYLKVALRMLKVVIISARLKIMHSKSKPHPPRHNKLIHMENMYWKRHIIEHRFCLIGLHGYQTSLVLDDLGWITITKEPATEIDAWKCHHRGSNTSGISITMTS